MESSKAEPHKRVTVFPELISGLFDAIKGPDGDAAAACLRDVLPYNVRLLRDEELPYEPVDERMRKQVEELERKVERLGKRVNKEREELGIVLHDRISNAMRVALDDNTPHEIEDETHGALPEQLMCEAKQCVGNVVSERVTEMLNDAEATRELATRVNTALEQLQNGSRTPDGDVSQTIMMEEDTPRSAWRSRTDSGSFASPQGVLRMSSTTLPFISPNVTPRSRTRRRTSSAQRRRSQQEGR